MNTILQKILDKKGNENLLDFLSLKLSESELNSFLLEVFKQRVDQNSPSQLLRDYTQNRFVKPSIIDPIHNLELELKILIFLKQDGFEVIEYSPLAPLGTSSVYKKIHQNNVVSALRMTEVVSDITNVFALEMAQRIKSNPIPHKINLAASHRMVRAQVGDDPNLTAHFKAVALASSSRDTGNYLFETEATTKHIDAYLHILKEVFQIETEQLILSLDFQLKPDDYTFIEFKNKVLDGFPNVKTVLEGNIKGQGDYYNTLRFGIWIESLPFPIVDGGFVNWMELILSDRKQRLLISGIGTELLQKIM